MQFGDHTVERTLGQQGVGDADELTHATVNAAGARQDIAQRRVQQTFHGREQDSHGYWRQNWRILPTQTPGHAWRTHAPSSNIADTYSYQ